MDTFQRARSAEQRAARREAILATATEMLSEMPVSQLTMNGLSRRVGLAKSNVMRYFESREAVLLELLAGLAQDWLAEATELVRRGMPQDGALSVRLVALTSVLASSFAEHEVLCDLLSAQANVLEHNVSEDVALRYKRSAIEALHGLANLITSALPEVADDRALDAALTTIVLVGAFWTHSHPSAAMVAVYRENPSLAVMQEFGVALEQALGNYLRGMATASN